MNKYRKYKLSENLCVVQQKTWFGWMDVWAETSTPFEFGPTKIWQPFTVYDWVDVDEYMKCPKYWKFKYKFHFQTKFFLKRLTNTNIWY
jgi:hypothetical protein